MLNDAILNLQYTVWNEVAIPLTQSRASSSSREVFFQHETVAKRNEKYT